MQLKSPNAATAEPEGPFDKLGLRNFIGLFTLFLLVVISAMSLVYAKHLKRILYAQLETLQLEKDHYHIEWSQLLLERGTLASDARVEQLARSQLKMQYPRKEEIIVIQLKTSLE